MQRQIEGFRLSPQQERLWGLQQESAAYRAQCAVLLEGNLKTPTLLEALQKVIDRYEILRTNYCGLPGVKAPLQVIADRRAPDWREIDLTSRNGALLEDLIDRHWQQEASRSFDFQQGSLLRSLLLTLSPEKYVLLLSLPALCADTSTLTNLVSELSRAYAACIRGEELPEEEAAQYVQFSEWQNELLETEEPAAAGSWRLADLGTLLRMQLPFERQGPDALDFEPKVFSTRLNAGLALNISKIIKDNNTDAGAFFLSCWGILIYRLTGQTEIVIGTSGDGRKYDELKETLGLLAKYLPAQFQVEGHFEFTHVLERVHEMLCDLYRWQEHFVWERTFSTSGEADRKLAFFSFGFDFEPRIADYQADGVRFSIAKQYACFERFKVKLSCLDLADSTIAEFLYDSTLFATDDIERLAGQFLSLLEAVSSNALGRIGEFNILTAGERRELLRELSETKNTKLEERCIHRLIEAQVERVPDRVALVFEGEQLTYARLNARANQLAHQLQMFGVEPEQIVAVCMERSAEVLVAMLAVLKSGAAYVPLELPLPLERIERILEDSRAVVLLTRQSSLAQLPDPRPQTICLDAEWELVSADGEVNLADRVSSRNLLYVIFTSGSTGRPKGVAVEHRQLVNYLTGMRERLEVEDETSFAAVSTFAADLGHTSIFPSLCGGGTLHIVSHKRASDPQAMSEYFGRHDIGYLKIVPSHLAALLKDAGQINILPRQQLIVGGEACDRELIGRVQALAPQTRIMNHYGPTESTVGVLTYPVGPLREYPTTDTLPLGRPISNTQIYLLDDHLEPVPKWVAGELYIGGDSLARGYLNSGELTAEKFIPNPFSREPGARMYRTGDVARFRSHGNVEFLGRADHQIKLRGYRIELGEIEAALRQHPSVQEAIAVVRDDQAGDRQLVAYVVCGSEKTSDAVSLWRFLRDRLPEYMLPSGFVMLNALPLTPNGKIDRGALPALEDAQAATRRAFVAPRTQMEEVLASIWEKVLRIERVSVYDNFFELGGHSLLGTQLISRVQQVFKVDVPVRQLFETPTLSELAENIESLLRGGTLRPALAIDPVSRNQPLPLSFAQQRLWFVDQLMPDTPAYNVPRAVPLRGELAVTTLEQSLNEVVRRHEVLRTRFGNWNGEPVQVIDPFRMMSLPLVDLSGLDETAQEVEARRLANHEAARPFDLRRGPLLRAFLLRLTELDHVTLLTMHHIVSDAWSGKILHQEMTQLSYAYREGLPSPLAELTIQFSDFAVWQRQLLRGELLEEQIAFWKTQLAGSPPLLEMPADRPRPPVQSFRAESLPFALPEELLRSLHELSRDAAATLYMTLLAAFQTLLARYSGQPDIVVGVPIAGRNRIETEKLIGFFINTLAIRTDLAGSPGFRLVLRRVREVLLIAYSYQDLPFEKLVEELDPERSLSHTPLFQAVLMFDNTADVDETKRFERLGSTTTVTESWTAKFDLTLSLTEAGGRLVGSMKYSSDLYDRDRIGRMLEHFQRLLEEVVRDPEQDVWRLPLLTEAERQHLLTQWNDTRTDYPGDTCLPDLFEAQAQQTPDRVALVFDEEQITYGGLERRANQLARHLLALGAGAEQVVAICVERSPEMLVGVLGVHKAGAAYLPLDPSYPQERLAFMLADARARVFLTQESLLTGLPDQEAIVVCLDAEWDLIARQSGGTLKRALRPENPAYVIYTSGSTGKPKGVLVSHYGACNRMFWGQSVYGLGEADNVLHESSFSFDFSVWAIYGPLMAGARVVLTRPGGNQDPGYLLNLISARQISVVHFVPSMVQLLADDLNSDTCPALRLVFCGGEALPAGLQERLLAHLQADLYNQYGATEASINSTYWICREEEKDAVIPIGRPIENTWIYLLDAGLETVPMGVHGEIHIGGMGLARGYINRPDLTAERFIPDAFAGVRGARMYRTGDVACYRSSGVIRYLGRKDHQVKIRGFRIELGEIEKVLSHYPNLTEAVVLVREDVPGDRRLVAYVVAEQAEPLNGLRHYLQSQLPEHMVPSALIRLESMPLTPNGKLDRQALPVPEQIRPDLEEAYVAPQTLTQELLTNIWAQVLGVQNVGIHDNFFDLGGHSLLATQVTSRVKETFQAQVQLKHLFESPTVFEYARAIEATKRDGLQVSQPTIQRAQSEGALPLSHAQQRLWFLAQLAPNRSTYNMRSSVRLVGRPPVAAIEQGLSEVMRRHEVLRVRFVSHDGQPLQVVSPAGPLKLTLIDLSALDANAQRAQVVRLAESEGHRPFDLTNGPMLRARLLRLNDQFHLLLLTLHHIVSDAWSMRLLRKEVTRLGEAYWHGAASSLEELPVQYSDYSIWQQQWLQGEVLEEQVRYWRGQLGSDPPVLELPLDRQRPAIQSFRGAHCSRTLSEHLSTELKELSRDAGVTLFMALLAAFKVLLSRHAGQTDVVMGVPIAGRNRTETEGLIGFFINTLVIRTDLSGDPCFSELLKRVREIVLGAYTNQDLPFEKLVEELQPKRTLSHTPLFQVFFNMINLPGGEEAAPPPPDRSGPPSERSELPAGRAEWVIEPESKFDLTLYVSEREQGIHLQLVYNADLFLPARMAEMLEQFEYLLSQIVAHPDGRLGSFSLVTQTAARLLPDPCLRLESRWEGVIHEEFSRQARSCPDHPAVVDSQKTWSYAELEARSNQLAHYLREKGIERGDVVAIYGRRSASLVWALLGVLKAGGAFLILDSKYPAPRLISFLDQAKPCGWLQLEMSGELPLDLAEFLSEASLRCRLTLPAGDEVEMNDLLSGFKEQRLGIDVLPDDVAYIAFTSGTTGVPRGIVGQHRPLSHFLEWQRTTFELNPSERFSLLSGLSHDPLLRDIFAPLLLGATLYVPDWEEFAAAESLAAWMNARLISVAHLTPALGQLLASAGAEETGGSVRLPCLRHAFFSGDVLSRREVTRLRELAPAVTCVNFYGTTETPQAMSYFIIPAGDERADGAAAERLKEIVPLGRGIKNAQLLVFNSAQALAGVGELGEIYVRSPHLAKSYLNDETLTSERFIINPHTKDPLDRLYRTGDLGRFLPDGEVEFAGRFDRQVKIRGFRIELEEIETVLSRYSGVGTAVVLPREDVPGNLRLIAFVVPESKVEIELDTRAMRQHLQAELPDYMVPSLFVTLSELPLTPNGKVDRRALLAMGQARPAADEKHETTLTPIAETLVGIWSEVLGRESVGVNDDFFELGGHSLLATKVMSRVRQVFAVELPLSSLFERPTVAGLAELIEAALRGGVSRLAPPLKRVRREQPLPLSFGQWRLWFLDQMAPHSSAYNMRQASFMQGPLSLAAMEQCFSEVLRRHEVLRTRFVARGGEPEQVIDPARSLRIPLVDLSGLGEPERKAVAGRLAAQEGERPFALKTGPLSRAALLKLSGTEHVILMSTHHILSDGWSTGILRRELTEVYESCRAGAPSPLDELPFQYADYAVWQREWLQSGMLEEHLNYWKRQLSGIRPLELLLDFPRPEVQTFRGERQFIALSSALATALRLLSRREGVTLFMTLLAAFKTLLHLHTGQADIAVGTAIANRHQPEIERLIGFFVNMLVLRTDLSGNPSFHELLARVRQVCLGAYAHQDLPFEKLVEELQTPWDLSRTPLFQVAFSLQTAAPAPPEPSDMKQMPLALQTTKTRFDLTLVMTDTGHGLQGALEYNTALFDAASITQLLAQYQTLLTAVAANPEHHLLDIRLVDERTETDQPDHTPIVRSEYAADQFDF